MSIQLHLAGADWWPWALIFPGMLALVFERTRRGNYAPIASGYALIAAGYALAAVVGQLQWPALGSLAVLAVAGWWVVRSPFRGARLAGHLLLLLATAALWLHAAPGFQNPLALAGQTSVVAAPGRLYFNLDKTLVAVWIIACLPGLSWYGRRANAPGALLNGTGIGALTFLASGSLALMAGAVAIDVKVPAYWWVWLLNNALLVSFAEEAFFRGYVQGGLGRWLAGRWGGERTALVAGALLFGLAHLGQGPVMAGLSALSGLGYGLAYRRAGLVGAISAHLALNTLHFFLLTYPALLRLPAS